MQTMYGNGQKAMPIPAKLAAKRRQELERDEGVTNRAEEPEPQTKSPEAQIFTPRLNSRGRKIVAIVEATIRVHDGDSDRPEPEIERGPRHPAIKAMIALGPPPAWLEISLAKTTAKAVRGLVSRARAKFGQADLASYKAAGNVIVVYRNPEIRKAARTPKP